MWICVSSHSTEEGHGGGWWWVVHQQKQRHGQEKRRHGVDWSRWRTEIANGRQRVQAYWKVVGALRAGELGGREEETEMKWQ